MSGAIEVGSMKLSVIIPCYKDDPTRAIQSIKNQLYYDPRDVEIIVSSDDPEVRFFCPNSPSWYYIEDVICIPTDVNTGPGGARQRGFDMATGEYITFIDADDIWYNSLGYALFLRDVYWQGGNIADIVKLGILEQLSDGSFNQIYEDSTWCFGKIYRRKFLEQNNIRFHPDLRVHEDSYFVRMAELCNPRTVNHSDAVYLWRDNPHSIVRNNGGEYWQKEFSEYIKVLLMLRDERMKRGLSYDGVYDLAYSYTAISRMDEVYADQCIRLLREARPGWGVDAMRKGQLCECLRMVEGQKSMPRVLPKFTLKEFVEAIEV